MSLEMLVLTLAARNLVADDDGAYAFHGLPPGSEGGLNTLRAQRP